jgi:DNA-binding beta-propeller fold protein YncE
MNATAEGVQPRRRRGSAVVLLILVLVLALVLAGIVYVLLSLLNSPEHKPVLANKPGVKLEWQALGGSFGDLRSPMGVSYDGDNRIYVTEAATGRVLVFDKNGKNGRLFLTARTEKSIRGPLGVDVASDGSVYVADPSLSSVVVFNADGKKLRAMPFPGASWLTVSGNRLYVLNGGTIFVSDLQGNILARWGSRGQRVDQMTDPGAVVVDNNKLYLTDMNNYRVFSMTPDFVRLWQIGGAATTDKTQNARVLDSPAGMTLGADGNLYVVDGLSSAIRVFNKAGKEVSMPLGGSGTTDDSFYLPRTIDHLDGDMFVVADTFNNRIMGVRLTPQAPQAQP